MTAANTKRGAGSLTDEGLARIDDAKDFLQISRSAVYLLMETGQLRYCKVGRSRRIPWRALRDFANTALVQIDHERAARP